MYGLTTIKELIKNAGRTRGLVAVALAALISLSALPTQTRAQGASTNTYGGSTFVHTGTIGVVPGQRVSVTVPNFYFQDGSVRFVKHTIKVYATESGGLIYSGESGGIYEHEVGHVLTFSVPGVASTDRTQLWIEVESFPPSAIQRTDERSAVMLPPTFELIDERSGKTVVYGLLLPAIMKVR
jgi:hypothetical protein